VLQSVLQNVLQSVLVKFSYFRSMVLGAKVKVEIYLTPDKQWQISTETAIKVEEFYLILA